MSEAQTYSGGCHCGAVRFDVVTPLDRLVTCNCSICQRTGAIYAFVPAADFTLTRGGDAQTDYQFNRKIIHHFFCSTCGIRSYGRGKDRDGAETIAVNVRCLDDVDVATMRPTPLDGRSL